MQRWMRDAALRASWVIGQQCHAAWEAARSIVDRTLVVDLTTGRIACSTTRVRLLRIAGWLELAFVVSIGKTPVESQSLVVDRGTIKRRSADADADANADGNANAGNANAPLKNQNPSPSQQGDRPHPRRIRKVLLAYTTAHPASPADLSSFFNTFLDAFDAAKGVRLTHEETVALLTAMHRMPADRCTVQNGNGNGSSNNNNSDCLMCIVLDDLTEHVFRRGDIVAW